MSSKHTAALRRRWTDPAYREKQNAVNRRNTEAMRGKRPASWLKPGKRKKPKISE